MFLRFLNPRWKVDFQIYSNAHWVKSFKKVSTLRWLLTPLNMYVILCLVACTFHSTIFLLTTTFCLVWSRGHVFKRLNDTCLENIFNQKGLAFNSFIWTVLLEVTKFNLESYYVNITSHYKLLVYLHTRHETKSYSHGHLQCVFVIIFEIKRRKSFVPEMKVSAKLGL